MDTSELLSLTLTELALSVDNALVWAMVLSKLGLPKRTERAVLAAGVAIAFVVRFVAIALGAAAIEKFWWLTPVLGLLLIVTGVKLLKPGDDDDTPGLLDRLSAVMSPAAAGVVTLGAIDILFAVDSIPASFGISQHAGTIIAANAVALAALWSIYGGVSALLAKLPHLHYGLAAVLVWLGAGMLAHGYVEVPSAANLGVIAAMLGASAMYSVRTQQEA